MDALLFFTTQGPDPHGSTGWVFGKTVSHLLWPSVYSLIHPEYNYCEGSRTFMYKCLKTILWNSLWNTLVFPFLSDNFLRHNLASLNDSGSPLGTWFIVLCSNSRTSSGTIQGHRFVCYNINCPQTAMLDVCLLCRLLSFSSPFKVQRRTPLPYYCLLTGF